MVKHIVLYNLKEGYEKDSTVKFIASTLEPLVGKIPGLLHLEVRRTFQGMDYALYSEFESREAMEAYAVHPLHIAAKDQFFHMLDFVSQPRGLNNVGGGWFEITQYASCMNADRGIYYYTTYENRRITGVDMHREDLDGNALISRPLDKEPQIFMHN